jgi:hypothetical protein
VYGVCRLECRVQIDNEGVKVLLKYFARIFPTTRRVFTRGVQCGGVGDLMFLNASIERRKRRESSNRSRSLIRRLLGWDRMSFGS